MGDDVDINLKIEEWKRQKMVIEDDYDQFIYKEWRSYLYRYITLIVGIVGFSVTLFGTDNLSSKVSFQTLLTAYEFLGYSVLAGFVSIAYSLWKERRILWGKMYGTMAGEYLSDDGFKRVKNKTKVDYKVKQLYDEVNPGVNEYPMLFSILTIVTFAASVLGFYYLVHSLQ